MPNDTNAAVFSVIALSPALHDDRGAVLSALSPPEPRKRGTPNRALSLDALRRCMEFRLQPVPSTGSKPFPMLNDTN